MMAEVLKHICLHDQQLQLEEEILATSLRKADNQLRKAIDSGDVSRLPEGQLLLKLSIDNTTAKLEDLFASHKGIAKTFADFEHHKDMLAYVIIVTTLRELVKEPAVPLSRVLTRLSKAVVTAIADLRLETRTDNLQAYIDKRYKNAKPHRRRAEKQRILDHLGVMAEGRLETRSTAQYMALLLEALLKSGSNIIETRMVFSKGKTQKFVILTADAYKVIEAKRLDYQQKLVITKPLLIPPKPWTSFNDTGGYLTDRDTALFGNTFSFPAIKPNLKGSFDASKLLERYLNTHPEAKANVFGGLNKLSATKWRINKPIFEVMKYVYDNRIEDVTAPRLKPCLVGGLPIQERLDAYDYVEPKHVGGVKQPDNTVKFPEGSRGWREYYMLRDEMLDHVDANSSRSLSLSMTLGVAESFKDYDAIYFSYQYDYRGRVYPLQSHLNPIGPDYVKALLQFAEGRAINSPEALQWLKVHGANTMGFDKLSFEERVAKVDELEDQILEIADDPLGTRNIWSDFDEPYMGLAFCLEYAAYLRDHNHPVRIAVALDATCSGIQIYSGLLQDAAGAEAVNVTGNNRNDIYQQVADRTNELLREKAYETELSFGQDDGSRHTWPTQPVADSFKGRVDRKLVKTPVMTTPYSVTERGMRAQVLSRLQELEDANDKFWVGETWFAAMFITKVITQAIDDVVVAAKLGQEYLVKLAKDIGKTNQHIFFPSLLTGFPVLLDAKMRKKRRLHTTLGQLTLYEKLEDTDVRRLTSGVAPNVIHSLDSTLLIETVNRLDKAGVKDLWLIHDSYGVHPNDVAVFNETIRDVFVDLFEAKPLQHIVDTVDPDYEHSPADVMVNTLNLDEVRKSSYIFS